jgi:predicted metal-dependent phosphoesterase TrpH
MQPLGHTVGSCHLAIPSTSPPKLSNTPVVSARPPGQSAVADGTADLHIHTTASDGLLSVQETLAHVEERTKLDVVAITDHDTVDGALEAREWATRQGLRVQVITGLEVTTSQGHVVALFVERAVPPHRPVFETLAAIHEQGGLAIIAHPMSWLTNSVTRPALDAIVESRQPGVHIDGIEVFNNSLPGRVGRRQAWQFCERHGIAMVGGSDAHFQVAIGSAITRFPGRTAADLRQALQGRTTRGELLFDVGIADMGFRPIATIFWRRLKKRGSFLPVREMFRNVRER